MWYIAKNNNTCYDGESNEGPDSRKDHGRDAYMFHLMASAVDLDPITGTCILGIASVGATFVHGVIIRAVRLTRKGRHSRLFIFIISKLRSTLRRLGSADICGVNEE